MEAFIIWIAVIAIIAIIIFSARFVRARKETGKVANHIKSTLQDASSQKALFDLKLMNGGQHTVITAILADISSGKLTFQCKSPVSQEWNGGQTEAYFRTGHEDSAVFYVFTTKILSIDNTEDRHTLLVAAPNQLRVEKKRHFLRVQPNPKDILMIAVWPMMPGQRLPGSSNDIGSPPVNWKSGSEQKNLKIDNISGSGVALTFGLPENEELPGFQIAQGKQILCLIVWRTGESSPAPVLFWCAGEIKNIRKTQSSVTLGLEFTNTAIQQQGSSEIHWTHASPWKGVKPVIQWVQQIDKSQN